MKTQINIFDHVAGIRDSVEIPLPLGVIVRRLQSAIGEPQFEIFDGDDVSVYARVDDSPIVVHVFGYSADAAAARWNEILGEITRKGVTV